MSEKKCKICGRYPYDYSHGGWCNCDVPAPPESESLSSPEGEGGNPFPTRLTMCNKMLTGDDDAVGETNFISVEQADAKAEVLQASLEAAKARIVELEGQGWEYVKRLDDAKAENEKLKEELERAETARRTHVEELHSADAKIASLQAENDKLYMALDTATDLMHVPEQHQDDDWYTREKAVAEVLLQAAEARAFLGKKSGEGNK